MSRSLIQTTNQASQVVAVDSTIGLGSVLRRFGCNCRLNGNAIEIDGEGYYTIDADIIATPDAAGTVTVALYENGLPIQGAIASTTVAATDTCVTLPITTTVRRSCCCTGGESITCRLIEGASTVSNVSLRVVKE